jgi:hypothetical protein
VIDKNIARSGMMIPGGLKPTATCKVKRVELSEKNGALLWSADRLAKNEGAGDERGSP